MKQTHVSRAGRKAQILMAIYEDTAEAKPFIFTPYFIAKRLELAPSTHIAKIVAELAEAGWLNQEHVSDLWGRKVTRVWLTGEAFRLLEDAYAEGKGNLKFVKSWFE